MSELELLKVCEISSIFSVSQKFLLGKSCESGSKLGVTRIHRPWPENALIKP